jgi:glycerophosphoryl diester phosphodiesterase
MHSLAKTMWASLCLLLAVQSAMAIEIVAHRGSKDEAPENTFAAAKRCIELGVHYLDTDVQMSKDGVFYVFHDFTVGRTTDGSGLLAAMTSDEIDKLDAGIKFGPQFKGERVPRLEDYLKFAKGKAKIYIDFKNGDLAKLVQLVESMGMGEEVFFWSFSPAHALKLRELAPKWALKINASTPEEAEAAVATFKATMIETNVGRLTPELRAACAKLNLKIMLKASDDTADEYRAIIAANPDYANIDFPVLFKQALAEK